MDIMRSNLDTIERKKRHIMELTKIIDYTKSWKGKDGKERPSTRFYLSSTTEDGKRLIVAIKPCFDSASDYFVLQTLANVKVIKLDKEVK